MTRESNPAGALQVLIMDSEELQVHALVLLSSPRDVASVWGPKAALSKFREQPFDIALLAVETSLLQVLRIAAGIRAIERESDLPRPRVAIIACTLNERDYHDSLVARTGLSGVLNSPWTDETVHTCLNQWRAGKDLGALPLSGSPSIRKRCL